jgi:hyaluronan synthase
MAGGPGGSTMTPSSVASVASRAESVKRVAGKVFWFILATCVLLCLMLVKSTASGSILVDPLVFFYSILVTLFQLSRLVAAILYERHGKEISALELPAGEEPMVTFVVPCMNEEDAIAATIESCFAANYPSDKLEVIVIDDGSTDRTPQVLAETQSKYPQLKVITFAENQGKRHGMAEGIRRASGEIIVQLDSDSYIDPASFPDLIAPFQNPQVGAVCAHADPANADKNLLSKMQAAYYFMSFRVLKAAESAFHIVFCCSGCCSAYRRSIIEPMLEPWLQESFLGKPVTWGDDRALTNRVIEAGYKTIYADHVQAYTIVPESVRQLIKQQIRWKKGWLVNSLRASRFIVKIDPFVAFTYFFPLLMLTLLTPFMAVRAFIWAPLFSHVWPVSYVLGVFLIAALVTVYYRRISPTNQYWPYVFFWSGLNMLVLSFVLFFAIADLGNRKWGTR